MKNKSFNPFALILARSMLDKVKNKIKANEKAQKNDAEKRVKLKEEYDDAIARLDLRQIELKHEAEGLQSQFEFLCDRGVDGREPTPTLVLDNGAGA